MAGSARYTAALDANTLYPALRDLLLCLDLLTQISEHCTHVAGRVQQPDDVDAVVDGLVEDHVAAEWKTPQALATTRPERAPCAVE